jgi:hypothetical protein
MDGDSSFEQLQKVRAVENRSWEWNLVELV